MNDINNNDDLTLDSLFEEISQKQPQSPYQKYYFLSNPFPAGGQANPFPGICIDQDNIKREFARTLRELYLDGQSKRMAILGSTGAGKTNLLRFFEQQIRAQRESQIDRSPITDLFTIYIQQPQGGYPEIHRQIISQMSALFFSLFFEAIQNDKINLDQLPALLPGISPELIRILRYVADRGTNQTSMFGINTQNIRSLENWLQGLKLSPAERKLLGGVNVEVGGSSTIAIKYLSDLFRIFKHAGLYKVIVILFDEFEEIVSGSTTSIQAKYAQDLRNLFDSLNEGVIFIIATVPIMETLEQISPALKRRLDPGIQIEPIHDEILALEYAREYIRLGRDRFTEHTKNHIKLPSDLSEEEKEFYPLTSSSIVDVYLGVRGDVGGTVLPGDFLPILNRLLYQTVYEVS